MAGPGEVKPLQMVLSPIQLAAIMRGDSIPEPATRMNRFWGGVACVGGVAELIGAAALLVTPEPTTATKVGGAALGLHGLDTVQAGARQMATGQDTRTVTSNTVSAGAQLAGLDPQSARLVGVLADIAVPFSVGASLRAARVMSIRAGVIATVDETTVAAESTLKTNAQILAEYEAQGGRVGGHMIRKHVAMKQADVLGRLLRGGQEAITTFYTIEKAVVWVSKGLRVNASAISFWAQTANEASKPLELVVECGTNIGWGFARVSDFALRRVQCQRFVMYLVRSDEFERGYFLLTAYPIP